MCCDMQHPAQGCERAKLDSCSWKQNDKDLLQLPVFSLLMISSIKQQQPCGSSLCLPCYLLIVTVVDTLLSALYSLCSSFQALQCLSKLLDELARVEMVAVTNTRHILINTEGKVHRNTFLAVKESRPASSRQRAVSENKVRERGQQSISDINKAREYSAASLHNNQISPHTERLSASALRLIITLLQCRPLCSLTAVYCVVSRSPRGPRPASDQE